MINLRELYSEQCLEAEKVIAAAIRKLEVETGLQIKHITIRQFQTKGNESARELLFQAEPPISEHWGREEDKWA